MEEKPKEMKTWPGMNAFSMTKSFALKTLYFGIIWGFGYMNWNFAWLILPIAYLVLVSEKKKTGYLRRLTAQATALSKDRIIVESRIDELPSWVFFPDYSRVEWLNEIVFRLWPTLSISDKFQNKVQKILTKPLLKIKKKIPGMGKEIKFEKVNLGKIPPKIMGVKVHHVRTGRDQILLDLDVMYAGDCDITFYMGNLRAGMKDFQLRGTLRLVLKSLLPVEPFVGGYQVFFFNRPVIDFELVGVAEVLDLPGIDDAFRRMFGKKIAKKFVLPNKYTKHLSKKVSAKSLKLPQPEGVLQIHVIEAENLVAKDNTLFSKGKSDPYVFITVGAQEFKTQTMERSVNPKWDFLCEALIDCSTDQKVEITVWDEDPRIFGLNSDDFLGRANVEVSRIKKKELTDAWLPLESIKHGKIHICFTWFDLSSDPADIKLTIKETQELKLHSISNAILILFIEAARNLPLSENGEEPDVYVEASVENKIMKTKKRLDTCNPVWEQGFTFFVSNFETSVLHIKVYDVRSSTIIGRLIYNISSLLKQGNLEQKLQPYSLKSNYSEGEITMSMALKIIKHTDYDINEIGKNDKKSTTIQQKINHESSCSSSSGFIDTTKILNDNSESTNYIPEDRTENSMIEAEVEEDGLEPELDISRKSSSLNSSNSLSYRNSEDSISIGKIQITLEYNFSRQNLTIIIHKTENLAVQENQTPSNLDFYVKLYLLPNKSKETKQKTGIVKSSSNPIFEQKFEYVMSEIDLKSQFLEVSLRSKRILFKKGTKCIGKAVIHLSALKLNESSTEWYDLYP